MALICFQGCGQKSKSIGKHPKWLNKAYEAAQKAHNIRSLLVSHNDVLVAEAYFDRYSRDSLDHIRSITKSVMATLIGIAIDQGLITGVDESITTYLGQEAKGKEAIKIKHLLTMTSGLQWNETYGNSEFNTWASSRSPYQYVLNKSMAHAPGEVWNYNTGAVHLLSVILTKASGMSTLDFAQKYLFKPIGVEKVQWRKLSDGYYNGGAALLLKPRDMIKFGQLYVDKGSFNGKRIVSENFIKVATSHHQPKDMKLEKDAGYGYCWYLGKYFGNEAAAALGYAGQMIAFVPERNLVMVVTHNWRGRGVKVLEQDKMASSTLPLLIFEELSKQQ